MTEPLVFFLAGEPKPKQGDRSYIAKSKMGKRYIQHYTDKSVTSAQNAYRFQLQAQLPSGFTPIQSAVALEVEFRFAPLKSKNKLGRRFYKPTRPDIDNLLKLLLDVLKGVLIQDDNLIVEIRAKKVYSASEDGAGIWLHCKQIPDNA